MIRHFFALVVALLISYTSGAQSLNTYKYVVVPDSYGFLKGEKDRYQLNSLTQFLFQKYGFTAIMKDEPFPEDLQNGGCNALYADVNNISSMFTIKLEVQLRDCKNKVVFTSQPGRSKNKEFKKGYHEALRGAFMDVKRLNYVYNKPMIAAHNPEASNTVVTPERENTASIAQDTSTAIAKTPQKVSVTEPVVPTVPKIIISGKPSPIKSTANRQKIEAKKVVYLFKGETYDFKKSENGYTLHKVNNDGTSTVAGSIFGTSRANSYLVKAATLSGNGYFDDFGNFVLERVNPATGKVITDIFAREDR